jgi:hypothetical protein
MPVPRNLVAALLASVALLGCGGAYQPSRAAPLEIDPAVEIDDEDVRKAFEARPQLAERVHVAFYTFDPKRADEIGKMLGRLPGVESVYRIPPLVVTGQRRFQETSPWEPPREISIKKLRLLAARARADVLIVVDHGFRYEAVNPLVALNLLVVPIFFVPFLDNEVEGYAEAFVIDTRNGYLYGHLTADDKRGKRYANIYDDGPEALAEEQWQRLEATLLSSMSRLVTDERGSARKAAASVEPPAAPPEPPARP